MKYSFAGIKAAQQAIDRRLVPAIVDETGLLITVILQGIAAHTKPYVPVDTSALINSEQRTLTKRENGYVGEISYGGIGINATRGVPVQQYAAHVHEGPQKNWQKPGASNQFLAKGAADFIRDDLSSILARFQAK